MSACLIFFKWLDKADVPGDIRVYKRQNPDILCIQEFSSSAVDLKVYVINIF
jgi:hypothetical protein